MNIGLYSDIAREHIVEARKQIAKKKYTSSLADIKKYREEIFNMNDNSNSIILKVLDSTDFYSMSACRDLLFHIQEHRFTLLQIEAALNNLGLKFLGFELKQSWVKSKFFKLYPDYYGQSREGDGYKPIFEWANQKEIPIMCHGRYGTDAPGTTQLKRYEKFTKDYPKIKWVIAHAGGGTELDSVKTAKELPNIWLETCGSGNPLYAVSYAVNHGLSDRLLFGSDMPIMDYRNQIAKVITADISRDDKKKILGLNAIKLLNL